MVLYQELNVSVVVNGKSATELRNMEHVDEDTKIERYIEAPAGTQFSILLRWHKQNIQDSEGLACIVQVDNFRAKDVLLLKHTRRYSYVGVRIDAASVQPFEFAALAPGKLALWIYRRNMLTVNPYSRR